MRMTSVCRLSNTDLQFDRRPASAVFDSPAGTETHTRHSQNGQTPTVQLGL